MIGSIVARFIFQTVEEVAYSIFSKLLSKRYLNQKNCNAQEFGMSIKIEAINFFNILLKFIIYIGMFHLNIFCCFFFFFARSAALCAFFYLIKIGLYFVTFGPAFSFLVLHIFFGAAYSNTSAPSILSAFCFFILVMGINGITETFVHAVASEVELRFFNILMIIIAVGYMIVATLLIRVEGTIGLIIANCLSILFLFN